MRLSMNTEWSTGKEFGINHVLVWLKSQKFSHRNSPVFCARKAIRAPGDEAGNSLSHTCSPRGKFSKSNMAAIVRQCSRITLRSLTAISLRSRPAHQAILSPLLRKNLKVEWKVDINPKYFCSHTQTVIENSNPVGASPGQTGQSDIEVLTGESDDSELISSSSNDLHRISQRLGSVRHEETLIQAFHVIKNAEGNFDY